MIYKPKRYLGNTNTLELHDTRNEQDSCNLDRIAEHHKKWYDSIAEAKADKAYDNCHWCIGGSTR